MKNKPSKFIVFNKNAKIVIIKYQTYTCELHLKVI